VPCNTTGAPAPSALHTDRLLSASDATTRVLSILALGHRALISEGFDQGDR
jgi:hypothetical protein